MGDKSDSYDIVFLGNYTKDTIVSPSGRRYADGGGFNYGAHAAAMMGLKVAAVTQLAKEDYHVVDALTRLGVDVFATATPESTRIRLEYPTSNVDERVLYCTSFAGAFTPDQVEALQAEAFLINASIRSEVTIDVIEELRKKDTLLIADVQSFIRIVAPDGKLIYEEWPEKRLVLSQIDVLKADALEAQIVTGEKEIKVAARLLADLGPEEIVITHRGGVLVLADEQFHQAPFFARELVGRSGRGDTCIAAYASKRLTSTPREATIWAAAVTSLKLEAEGPIVRKMSDAYDLIRVKYRDL